MAVIVRIFWGAPWGTIRLPGVARQVAYRLARNLWFPGLKPGGPLYGCNISLNPGAREVIEREHGRPPLPPLSYKPTHRTTNPTTMAKTAILFE